MHLKNSFKILFYVACGATVFTLFFGFILSISLSHSAHADEQTSDVVNVTVQSACTFGSSGGGTYSATMNTGSTQTITANNISISCNDSAGYAVYAIGYSGSSYYGTNTDLIAASGASNNIKTDGSGTYGSSWKMKITAVTNANVIGNYGSFQNIPATYAKVAAYTANTSNSVITPSYQVNISQNQVAGTYTGAVKYTLVHPNNAAAPEIPEPDPSICPANSICYLPNSDDIIGSMSSLGTTSDLDDYSELAGRQTKVSGTSTTAISASTTEIELIAPNFARAGYGFAGWSPSFEPNNNSTIYGPNETISIEAGQLSTNGLILYPVFIGYTADMQGWTGCSGLTTATYSAGKMTANLNSLTALRDTRDNNVYVVAKLADGNCWMIENLRLNAEHTTSAADIAKAQGYGQSTTYGNFIGLASSENAHFVNTAPNTTNGNTNDYYSSDNTTIINIGASNAGARTPRYNNNNTNFSNNSLTDSPSSNDDHSRWHSYGNYYTFAAAIASTIHYTSYYHADGAQVKNSDAAGTSICPTGWQLPLGFTSTGNIAQGAEDSANRVGGFSYFDRLMGGTGASISTNATTGATNSFMWRMFPNNIVYSGIYKSAAGSTRGSVGEYWTRSASGNTNSYRFQIDDSKVYPASINQAKAQGRTIRCIKQ